MKNTGNIGKRTLTKRSRLGLAIIAVVLFGAGVAFAFASIESPNSPPAPAAATKAAASNYVTVEVGGKKIQVNALTLQQGPLTQDQADQIADALRDNKSTEGLVQVQHANGTVEMDLQGRFQNVVLARRNDDGSISQACVDNPQAATEFLREKTNLPGNQTERKAAIKE